MSADTCPRRLGWNAHRLLVVDCDLPLDHPGDHGGIALPGESPTRVIWQEADRRTFSGEWMECPEVSGQCVLPAGHRGRHADRTTGRSFE